MPKFPTTFLEAVRYFADERNAWLCILNRRWPDGVDRAAFDEGLYREVVFRDEFMAYDAWISNEQLERKRHEEREDAKEASGAYGKY